jgi:hypothetical protein
VTRPQEEDPETSGTVSIWRGTAPEVLAAVVVVTATALAAYALAGWAGLTVVAAATTAAVMVLLRGLLPRLKQDTVKKAQDNRRPLTGYAHRLFVVQTALTAQGRYDSELRPVLEHLLAARLSEHHDVNLYQDPEAARKLLCPAPRDADLWRWIDPASPPEGATSKRRIPRRTLASLIDRLEKL